MTIELNWNIYPVDWDEYERRVAMYEAEGMTRSDAQAVVDAEIENEG